MNLYLKQRVFSWRDKFNAYDEEGNPQYYVQGEVFTLGKKLHIYNLNGEEICFIHQKVLSWLPKYFISKNEVDVAEVKKEFAFFHQAYSVNGFGWRVEGNFFAHEYSIVSSSGQIAEISKKWFAWGDTYELRISNGVNPVNVLAVVLVIDACMAQQQNSGR